MKIVSISIFIPYNVLLVEQMHMEDHAGNDDGEGGPDRGVDVAVDEAEHGAGHAARHHAPGRAHDLELHPEARPVRVRLCHV